MKTDVSEESIASIIKVTSIGELGTTLTVTSHRRQLRINTGNILLVTNSSWFVSVTANVVPSWLILAILMMEVYVLPKRQFLQEPHDVTSLKKHSS
jgi:hypothetical protein